MLKIRNVRKRWKEECNWLSPLPEFRVTTWRNVRAGYATFMQATDTKSVWRNVTMLINKTGCGGAYWFYNGKDTLYWWALVMSVMKVRGSIHLR